MSVTKYNELISAATAARDLAYAPYSGFQVGAAVATSAGKIYTGCNVENVSLGLTICAERSAIATAIAQGSKDFVAIAVVTAGKKPAVTVWCLSASNGGVQSEYENHRGDG